MNQADVIQQQKDINQTYEKHCKTILELSNGTGNRTVRMFGRDWIVDEPAYKTIHLLCKEAKEQITNLQRLRESLYLEENGLSVGDRVYKMGYSLLGYEEPIIGIIKQSKTGFYIQITTESCNKKRTKTILGWKKWEGD